MLKCRGSLLVAESRLPFYRRLSLIALKLGHEDHSHTGWHRGSSTTVAGRMRDPKVGGPHLVMRTMGDPVACDTKLRRPQRVSYMSLSFIAESPGLRDEIRSWNSPSNRLQKDKTLTAECPALIWLWSYSLAGPYEAARVGARLNG